MSDRPRQRDDKASRQDRLKAALRENLKRRKQQMRSRAEPAVAGEDDSPGQDTPDESC